MRSIIKKNSSLRDSGTAQAAAAGSLFCIDPFCIHPTNSLTLICCPHKVAGATRCDDPLELFGLRIHIFFFSLICFVHSLLSSWSPRRMHTPIYSRHREEISSQGSRGILTRVQRTVCTAGHSSTLRRNLETLNHCTCYCLVWDDDCHAITITVSTHPFISRVYSWHWFFHLVCHLFIIKHPHIGGYISYFLYAIIKYQAKASQGRKDYISGF